MTSAKSNHAEFGCLFAQWKDIDPKFPTFTKCPNPDLSNGCPWIQDMYRPVQWPVQLLSRNPGPLQWLSRNTNPSWTKKRYQKLLLLSFSLPNSCLLTKCVPFWFTCCGNCKRGNKSMKILPEQRGTFFAQGQRNILARWWASRKFLLAKKHKTHVLFPLEKVTFLKAMFFKYESLVQL